MSEKNLLENFTKYQSSRHHYIPVFLLNGFLNSDKKIYVYDKKRDKIINKPKPPKSIFFETERNSFYIKNQKSSVVEDVFYKMIDNKTSKVIKKFQTQSIKDLTFEYEDEDAILFFLITLFWRIPKTDDTYRTVIENSKLYLGNLEINVSELDNGFKKMHRASLFQFQMDQMIKDGIKSPKYVNIHKKKNEMFLIGDFPIVFRKLPENFSEFDNLDKLFALSSSTLYSSTNRGMKEFTTEQCIKYNLCVIHQSNHYAASSDLKLLEHCVDTYKRAIKAGIIENMNESVFN